MRRKQTNKQKQATIPALKVEGFETDQKQNKYG